MPVNTEHPTSVRAVEPNADPVVIVGLGIEAPGGIVGPGAYWDALEAGRSLLEPLPRDRGWDLDLVFSLPERMGWGPVPDSGGFLHDATQFDALFFGVTPREALAMDAQQRVAMRVAWAALQQAGINPSSLVGRKQRAGVFMGASLNFYGPPLYHPDPVLTGRRSAGVLTASVAGRISHLLDLRGPCMSLDAACASSLAALQQASNALLLGQCDWALAGGVCVTATTAPYVEFSRLQALDPTGYCRPYSAEAAGTIWSEGAVVTVVERLSRAKKFGHQVLAEVLSIGVNHNGAGAHLSVPSQDAQEQLYQQVLTDAGVKPEEITLFEGHGTGTAAGDPRELQAIATVYGQGREQKLALGSVKSNLGHAQAAAGFLGLTKAILAGLHSIIPPSLHADPPSTAIDWETYRIHVPKHSSPWHGRHLAAVSTFGLSGTNAHVIIEIPQQVDHA